MLKRPLLACAVVALTGCPHFVKLDPKNVTALEVGGDAKAQICARGSLVDVMAVTKDGKKFPEGDRSHPKENEFDPALVKLEATTGAFNDHSWNPPSDPLAMLSINDITVTASLVANPSVTASYKFQPTWACDAPVAYLGGQNGNQGDGGIQDGADGGPGFRGDNGQNVNVTVGWIQFHDSRLAIADVRSDGGESIYVLDPTTPLKILAGGGAGGAGGGGAFGRGMDTCNGKGGRGGRGGDGGDGGDGGTVTISYDASSPDLLQMVVADVSPGDVGPAGSGGTGGSGPNGCGTWGDTGAEGREGRAGHEGRVNQQPARGINQQLAGLAQGGPRPQLSQPPPRTAPTGPGARPTQGPPPPRDTNDGARYYTGRAEMVASMGAHKERQHSVIQVESTRTRRRHFTITFGQCKLELHRPPGEQQHRYVLDAPARCQNGADFVDVRDAQLELDTAHDGLALRFSGSGQSKAMHGTIAIDFSFTGKRR